MKHVQSKPENVVKLWPDNTSTFMFDSDRTVGFIGRILYANRPCAILLPAPDGIQYFIFEGISEKFNIISNDLRKLSSFLVDTVAVPVCGLFDILTKIAGGHNRPWSAHGRWGGNDSDQKANLSVLSKSISSHIEANSGDIARIVIEETFSNIDRVFSSYFSTFSYLLPHALNAYEKYSHSFDIPFVRPLDMDSFAKNVEYLSFLQEQKQKNRSKRRDNLIDRINSEAADLDFEACIEAWRSGQRMTLPPHPDDRPYFRKQNSLRIRNNKLELSCHLHHAFPRSFLSLMWGARNQIVGGNALVGRFRQLSDDLYRIDRRPISIDAQGINFRNDTISFAEIIRCANHSHPRLARAIARDLEAERVAAHIPQADNGVDIDADDGQLGLDF